jgi:hypothetical protein
MFDQVCAKKLVSSDQRNAVVVSHLIFWAIASFELSYHFIQGHNDPGAAFKEKFLKLINQETCECYIGSFTYTMPKGSLGLAVWPPLIAYEVLMYGHFANKIRKQYKVNKVIPTTSVSTRRLTPIFGRRPSVRRRDSSLTEGEWNTKFGNKQLQAVRDPENPRKPPVSSEASGHIPVQVA